MATPQANFKVPSWLRTNDRLAKNGDTNILADNEVTTRTLPVIDRPKLWQEKELVDSIPLLGMLWKWHKRDLVRQSQIVTLSKVYP
eukprot:m.52295 g.52295  ORF g.52295 m.52295 type:complete len:86 (-) comp10783_c0_seq4:174-431(-)